METPLLQSRLVDSFAPRSVAATLRLYRLPRGFPACGVSANTGSSSFGFVFRQRAGYPPLHDADSAVFNSELKPD